MPPREDKSDTLRRFLHPAYTGVEWILYFIRTALKAVRFFCLLLLFLFNNHCWPYCVWIWKVRKLHIITLYHFVDSSKFHTSLWKRGLQKCGPCFPSGYMGNTLVKNEKEAQRMRNGIMCDTDQKWLWRSEGNLEIGKSVAKKDLYAVSAAEAQEIIVLSLGRFK